MSIVKKVLILFTICLTGFFLVACTSTDLVVPSEQVVLTSEDDIEGLVEQSAMTHGSDVEGSVEQSVAIHGGDVEESLEQSTSTPNRHTVLDVRADANVENQTIDFYFTKVNESGAPLSGVVFNLYAYNEATNTWEATPIATRTSADATGLVSFDEFTGNRYKLVEVAAPTGFIRPAGYWVINISGSGEISIIAHGRNQPNFTGTADSCDNEPELSMPDGFVIPTTEHATFADPDSGVIWRVLVADDGDGNALIITEEAHSAGTYPFTGNHPFHSAGFNPTGYINVTLRGHMQRWANRGLWGHDGIGMVGPTLRSMALDFEFQDNFGNAVDRNTWSAGVEIPMLFGGGTGTIAGNQNNWICTRENANTTCPYRRAISRPTGEPGATFETDFDSTVTPLFTLSRTEIATYFSGQSLVVSGLGDWWTRSTAGTASPGQLQRYTLMVTGTHGIFNSHPRWHGARMRPAMWIRLPEAQTCPISWTLANQPIQLAIHPNQPANPSYIEVIPDFSDSDLEIMITLPDAGSYHIAVEMDLTDDSYTITATNPSGETMDLGTMATTRNAESGIVTILVPEQWEPGHYTLRVEEARVGGETAVRENAFTITATSDDGGRQIFGPEPYLCDPAGYTLTINRRLGSTPELPTSGTPLVGVPHRIELVQLRADADSANPTHPESYEPVPGFTQPVAPILTDENGQIVFTTTTRGIWRVTELDNNIVLEEDRMATFLIGLPHHVEDVGWQCSVTVYPKAINEDLGYPTKENIIFNGELATWRFGANIPLTIEHATRLDIVDDLDPRLTFIADSVVGSFTLANGDTPGIAGVGTQTGVLLEVDHFEVIHDQVANALTISMTEAGLTHLATNGLLNGQGRVYFTIETRVEVDESQQVGVITNAARFYYNNRNPLSDSDSITALALEILKVNVADQGLEGATFRLYREVQAETPGAIRIPRHDIYVLPILNTDETEREGTTNNDGIALIRGIYGANLWLREINPPVGYRIISEWMPVNVSDVTRRVEDNIITYTVDVRIYNEPANGWRLPATGGEGLMAFTIVGIALVSLAAFLHLKGKKNKKVCD